MGLDCTWRIEQKVKTFEMSCLFDAVHNFQEKCNVTAAPFAKVTADLLKAYASEDPSQGGCISVKIPGDNPDIMI